MYSLPSLPYDYSALEPYIDSTTMNIHHTKHHQTYVNNINAALAKHQDKLSGIDVLKLNQKVGTNDIPADISKVVQNSGGGHWNHSFFWTVMGKSTDNNGPSSELKEAIDTSFGSLDQLKTNFNGTAAGVFGSGWAWLGLDNSNNLKVVSTPNQNNPQMALSEDKLKPILGLDVWEHAYYLKYQNRRPEYISAFWNVVNWETVNKYYKNAQNSVIFTL